MLTGIGCQVAETPPTAEIPPAKEVVTPQPAEPVPVVEEPEIIVEPVETNFEKTGNLMIDNPGFEPNTWYLSYEVPGKAGLAVKLEFTESSMCSFAGQDALCYEPSLSPGLNVTITGVKEDNTVTVTYMILH